MKTILIIEDERDLREAIESRLLTEGYLVTAVETSEEGLMVAAENKPDLILLDIMTHSMHGSVFLQRLRQLPEGKNDSKVIILTNLDNDISRDKVLSHDIVDYLVKAKISLDEVVKKVSAALTTPNTTTQTTS